MKKESNSFSVRQRLKSFRFAFAGLATFFSAEHNARIHALATGAVIVGGMAHCHHCYGNGVGGGNF
jgi:diacylglycerol kinase